MKSIPGLEEYVRSSRFKEAMRIPAGEETALEMLAQGEYNINYSFLHPVSGKKFVFRINTGSQMHLEHQIEYEYNALKNLEGSGRTPKVYYVDGSKELLDYGVMVMEFLEGKPLDYHSDLEAASRCLADIHSTKLNNPSALIQSRNALQEILDECNQMVKTYDQSELTDEKKKIRIHRMLEKGQKKADQAGKWAFTEACINTELNSGNFLMNGPGKRDYLIDWEKPLLGDPAQDIGHFLAPTTTFWKTDVILSEEENNRFLSDYQRAVDGRIQLGSLKERVDIFIPITCLRGITWCAMAWVEYQQPDKLIQNMFTKKKLDAYLSEKFLDLIEQRYYR